MITDPLILIFCSFAISLLGLVIFVRNPARSDNRRFALLSLSMVVWTVFNYLSDHATHNNLLYTRLTFFGGVASAYALVAFIANFPSNTLFRKNLLLRIHSAYTVLLLVIVFMPGFISAVSLDPAEEPITTSYLYPLFLLYVLFSLGLLIVAIRRQTKHAKLAVQKQQVLTISWGIILYAILAVGSNVLLPLLIDSWSTSRFGPVFTLILVGLVGYTVVKHKLFDIRLIIARSLGYIFSIAILGFVYGVLAFGVINRLFFENTVFTISQEVVYVLITVILAITFQPFKEFFDRRTRQIFYRDAYDPQVFLDRFNRTLVTNVDLQPLLHQATTIIEENIKAEYCLFVVNKTPYVARRTIGSSDSKLNAEALEEILTNVAKTSSGVIVAEEMGENDKTLMQVLHKHNVTVVGHLKSASGDKAEGIGYLILGPKKSGNPYNKQDINIIQIITNELVIAIQNSLRFEEIENFAATLQEKVNIATRQLRRTNEKLKALDETKDEFISMASHQLRTPLTSMKGYVSMVLEGDTGKISGDQRKMLDQAFVSSQRMVYLIADLLNVSRLRTGKFVIEAVPTNLAEAVQGEIEQLHETALGRGLELKYDKPKDFPTLMLDETKIRQVIMNFTDNAIYYSKSGGHINVALKDLGSSIEFTVTDDGIGVPKSEQHHLFNKFYRAGNAKKARPDGTGLGLFMAKKVIVAQGGSLIFKSQEGKGSTFGFSFAKAKLEPVPTTK